MSDRTASALGVRRTRSTDDDLKLHRLNLLWKIDKHRRLPRLTWLYRDIYWGGPAVPWRPALPNRTTIVDGELLGHFDFPTAESVQPLQFFVRVDLTLADDPFPFPQPAIGMLERWHQSLCGWVIPRVFITTVMRDSPPILISAPPGGWPC